jgi:hypothetical protein
MRLPLRQLRYALPALLLVGVVPSCKPPPESVQVKERVDGPPDLMPAGKANPANQSFQLSAFHLNHIWSSGGNTSTRPYRAKITVWDYAEDQAVLAELYFDDATGGSEPASSDPNRSKPPYQIHFPMSTIGPILGTLRNANEPIFLYYYEGAWAIGTYTAEPVGID